MRKIVLFMLAVFVLMGIAVGCEYNVYLENFKVWSVGPKSDGHVFSTANEAINYIMSRDAGKTKDASGVAENRTIYLLRPVLSSDSDALVIWGKSYILDAKYRGAIVVPEEFEGTLSINFNGFRYDFANNTDSFFRILGGSNVYIYNGETVIFKESQAPIANAALIVGTRTVTIDEHLIDDRRVGPEEEVPAAVYVTSDGALVFTCDKEDREVTGVSGTFTIENGGTVLIEEGTVTVIALEQGDEGGLSITGGEIHFPHGLEGAIENAIVHGCEDDVDKRIMHSPLKYFPAKVPTCTEDGNIEYWQCLYSGCLKYFSDEACTNEVTLEETIVAKLGHNLLHRDAVESTCTEHGYAEHWICQSCGHYFLDEDGEDETTWEDLQLPLAPHNYVDAWSHSNTHHWHECSVCHSPQLSSYHEHTWDDGIIIKELGEPHKDGLIRYTCTVCKYTYDRSIPAHDHIKDESTKTVVEPTCTEFGYTWYNCTVCKQKFIDSDSYVDPLNHPDEYREETQRVDATCTEDGHIHYWHCDLCGAYSDNELFTHIITKDETVIKALGHDPATAWTHDGTKHWRLCLRTGCGAHVDEGYHNEDRLCQDGDAGHHWECTVCGYSTPVEAHEYGSDDLCVVCSYEKPKEPQGSGGFDVTVVERTPKGELTYSHDETEYTVIYSDTNVNYPATSLEWYVNSVKQSETGKTLKFKPTGLYTHTVMCVCSNNYGVGSVTVVVNGF